MFNKKHFFDQKEFKVKQHLVKHCGTAHGYFPKTQNPTNNERPQVIRNRTAFFLLTTPLTRAARLVCVNTIKLERLRKAPFKLVELAELNKEWAKEKETRSSISISALLDERAKKVASVRAARPKQKLDVARIDVIQRNRVRLVKAAKKQQTSSNGAINGLNGQNGHAAVDDENSNDLVIDNDADEPKPDYFKYFEKKCAEPCYTPQQFLFPKPSYS